MVGTPDALKGACPVWGGLGGNRRRKGARRLRSTPVACTVLNGEGGETGIGTALCPYPTPTPTAFARASLRLLARLTANVRGAADKAADLKR